MLCSVRTPKQLLLLRATTKAFKMFHREQIVQTSDYNFLRERKAHVLTPQSRAIIHCKSSFTGDRDDLPPRVRARTIQKLYSANHSFQLI